VVESMDLENGLITHHRVYWGWVGFNKIHNASTRPASRPHRSLQVHDTAPARCIARPSEADLSSDVVQSLGDVAVLIEPLA
jgi:hypothetical protein